jgi:uncharacterized protein
MEKIEVRFMKKLFLLLNLALLVFLPGENIWAEEFADTPKLSVRGEASIFKPADQMEVSLGVVTGADSSAEALNENNRRMHQIIANLRALGLDESDYQTGRFHIRPIYQKPPKGSEEEEHAKINFYEVVNAIKIKTKKLDLADKIITAAVQGGANQIAQVNFSLNNPQSYREEAIKAAAQYAIDDANALANAVGVRLKRILNLSMDNWHQFPAPMMLSKRFEGNQNEVEQQEVLEPGKAEIHASVNVIFEIGQ